MDVSSVLLVYLFGEGPLVAPRPARLPPNDWVKGMASALDADTGILRVVPKKRTRSLEIVVTNCMKKLFKEHVR